MPYRFFDEVALADAAFEATGETAEEMFESAGLAVENTMVKDLSSVRPAVSKKISVKSDSLEGLLFEFLQELVFYKDSERLLFGRLKVEVDLEGVSLECDAEGEEIDMKRHELLVDVKAVTMHMFEVQQTGSGWRCQAVLDT